MLAADLVRLDVKAPGRSRRGPIESLRGDPGTPIAPPILLHSSNDADGHPLAVGNAGGADDLCKGGSSELASSVSEILAS